MLAEGLTKTRLIQKYKNKTITQMIYEVNVIRPTMVISTNEIKSLRYTIENIIEKITNHAYIHKWDKIFPLYNREYEYRIIYNYWVFKTSHISPPFIYTLSWTLAFHHVFVVLPPHASLYICCFSSYSLYKLISIS